MKNLSSVNLADRVEQFMSLRLPGQPMGMHMGTYYLVNDLWGRVRELETERDALAALLRAARSELRDDGTGHTRAILARIDAALAKAAP